MARFFFHLHECGRVSPDEDGVERTDLTAAHATAIKGAREIMCAEVKEGRLCLSCHIQVVDEHGDEVLVVPFRAALEISGL